MNEFKRELKKALHYINEIWDKQNDIDDQKSNFIYKVDTVDDVIKMSNIYKIDYKYALHRWYNFKTSTYCEKVFVENGAIKEEDYKNKTKDIYINGIPFDVKLTVYPKKLPNHPYDLKTRIGKNEMIKWMYKNQSQQGRKHMANRLFVVCDGNSPYENLCLKSDIDKLEKKIKIYMDVVKKDGFNELVIVDNGIEYIVKSDIICIN